MKTCFLPFLSFAYNFNYKIEGVQDHDHQSTIRTHGLPFQVRNWYLKVFLFNIALPEKINNYF